MKICILTPGFPPESVGGTARTASRVAQYAKGLGLDVHVAAFTVVDTPLAPQEEERQTRVLDGITIHRLKVSQQKKTDRFRGGGEASPNNINKMLTTAIDALHNKEKFNLIHAFFLYPAGYVASILAKRTGLPFIVTLVGNDVKRYFFHSDAVSMCTSCLEQASHVVALTSELLALAEKLSPIKGKGEVIYHSVKVPSELWQPHPSAGVFKIGSAGIFKYAQGLPFLFKAVAELKKSHDIKLELVGEMRAYERETAMRLIDEAGIRKLLVMKPALTMEDMAEWFTSLDAFVLPSVTEGCPTILMDAMASGVPCVATRVGAVEEIIKDGLSGLLVNYGNVQAMHDALNSLILTPNYGVVMGGKARERMREFSAERERLAWEAVYRGILPGV